MKAATVADNGAKILDAPTPKPKSNEVLVRVRTCGLNRADLIVSGGASHGSTGAAGTIVGMEFSGEVAEVGRRINRGGSARRSHGDGGPGTRHWRCAAFPERVKVVEER
jgi:NADPH2:quinone reductase